MKTIKVAIINNINYIKYPEGINGIKEFVSYLSENYNGFAELDVITENKCVAPYFIEEELEIETQYWNLSAIRLVKEAEAFMLTREEYTEKLKKIIAEKCVDCVHYSEDVCEDDYKSHMEHICLDGECYAFEKKK